MKKFFVAWKKDYLKRNLSFDLGSVLMEGTTVLFLAIVLSPLWITFLLIFLIEQGLNQLGYFVIGLLKKKGN